MTVFQHVLWGYELTYPDDWVYRAIGDTDGFAAIPEALTPGYAGDQSGHLLVRAEWNSARLPVGPLWNEHIARACGMIGAKKVGAAPWRMGGGVGFEAEIVLPKQSKNRLWTGTLTRDFLVLNFMVTHRKDERESFEPLVTRLISSLRFLERAGGIEINEIGIPLPPGYTPTDPRMVVDDIADPENWLAYDGREGSGALQAFYLREAPVHGWLVEEYVPFPGPSSPGFARLRLVRNEKSLILGIMPDSQAEEAAECPAKIVVKNNISS